MNINKATNIVYNEYNHPRKELYLKHQVIECNIELKWGSEQQFGYFVSSLRKFQDTKSDSVGKMSVRLSSAKSIKSPVRLSVNALIADNRIMSG